MPLQGRFYTAQELIKILGVSKQRVSNLARQDDWLPVEPGIYFSEQVEEYLQFRGIDPMALPIRDYEYPDGATPQQRQDNFSKDYEKMMSSVSSDDEG